MKPRFDWRDAVSRSNLAPMKRTLAAVAAVALLAGCANGSSSGAGGSSASAPKSSVAPSTPKPTKTVNPNVKTCLSVQLYFYEKISRTFKGWDIDANEFNQRVGRELRAEATHLFRLETMATGAVASAIHDEAKGLADVSVAIEDESDDDLATASSSGNSALAALRGSCNF